MSLLIQNKYRIIRLIGNGAYSQVFEAEHVSKRSKVAIKFDIQNNAISSRLIQNEIDIYLYLLKNKLDNICKIKSFGILENRNYIVLDKLDMDLLNYVSKMKLEDSFTYRDMVSMFNQCLKMIKNMHREKLIHRDIKPDNFLVDNKGKLYIVDFGLSTKYDSGRVSKNFIGNYLYASYNVHKESYIYDYKDDIISLFYMFMDIISDKPLPWFNIKIKNKLSNNIVYYYMKKDCNFREYYEGDEITLAFVSSLERYLNFNVINLDCDLCFAVNSCQN